MHSIKLHKIIEQLVENFSPFNRLSKENIPELAESIRVIEMYSGEVFQLQGELCGDYLFLVKGHLDLILPNGAISLLNTENTRNRPFVLPANAYPATLKAKDSVIVCHVNRESLDKLISWDEVNHADKNESNPEIFQQLGNLTSCHVLRSLPIEKAELALKRMRKVNAIKGEEIIRAGEQGKTFYIITSGKAEVWRQGIYDDELKYLDTLTAGCSFGNGALITGHNSDRTVRMIEDGTLLALDKKDFDQIIAKQLIKRTNAEIARSMLNNGYKLLDVRYEEEFEESYIPGAILIPLHELPYRIAELDSNSRYIVYCHSGNRSAVATMRLSQYNIEAWSMDGGIRDWPYTIEGMLAETSDRRTGPKSRRQQDEDLTFQDIING